MIWKKRDSSKTISEVIYRNTGMRFEDMQKVWNTPIKNIDKMAVRLREIANDGKSVTVFADYDCDGICSAVIMHLVLGTLGIKFKIMFPHRSTGYGLQVNDIANIDSDVIITIDNGIAAFEAIDAAKEKGIEVLVIDHHLKLAAGIPNADLIVDPHVFKNSEVDYEDWCGAGLGYELSRLICNEQVQTVALQFAAIATVADVVSLIKDNRRILVNGLELLNKSNVPSIRRLVSEISGYGKPYVDATTIGFKIGPIINAMGRIEDNAEYVYRYFISDDPEMLQHMINVNESRKEQVANAVDRAYSIIAEECLFSDVPLIIYDPNTKDGIVGVVAGRLAEAQNVPVICLTDSEEPGVVKGSARSPSVNIKEALDKVSDCLIKYGGHAGAAGITMQKDKIDELRMRFSTIFEGYEAKENNEVLYDLEIDASELNTTMNELRKFGPFGEGNPDPIFKVNKFKLFPRNGHFYQVIGNDGQTLKFFGDRCSVIGFDMAQQYSNAGAPKCINAIGKISENHFGSVETQVELIDFEAVTNETQKSDLAKALASKLAFAGF